MTLMVHADRVHVGEAAARLDRRPATLRQWCRDGVLPRKLMPRRNEKGWRYWTEEQLEGIARWMRRTDRRPGKGLKHYSPDPERLKGHLEGLRGPRR